MDVLDDVVVEVRDKEVVDVVNVATGVLDGVLAELSLKIGPAG